MAGTIVADTWQNGDGTQNYKVRAWVNFNGTGTVAIRASGNVSSITDNGVGSYTINLSNNMQDINYALSCLTGVSPSTGAVIDYSSVIARTTSSFNIVTTNGGETAASDASYANILVVR